MLKKSQKLNNTGKFHRYQHIAVKLQLKILSCDNCCYRGWIQLDGCKFAGIVIDEHSNVEFDAFAK